MFLPEPILGRNKSISPIHSIYPKSESWLDERTKGIYGHPERLRGTSRGNSGSSKDWRGISGDLDIECIYPYTNTLNEDLVRGLTGPDLRSTRRDRHSPSILSCTPDFPPYRSPSFRVYVCENYVCYHFIVLFVRSIRTIFLGNDRGEKVYPGLHIFIWIGDQKGRGRVKEKKIQMKETRETNQRKRKTETVKGDD